VDRAKLHNLKVVVNAGNGGAGLVIDQLEPHLPFEFVKVNHKPDGTFPNGVPNPMLEQNRAATADVVRRSGAAVGLHGMATTIVASSSMRAVNSSRAITSSACWRRSFSSASRVPASSTIRD